MTAIPADCRSRLPHAIRNCSILGIRTPSLQAALSFGWEPLFVVLGLRERAARTDEFQESVHGLRACRAQGRVRALT